MADLFWPGDERAGDHFTSPALLRAMVTEVRPGGVVAVEDIYTPSLHADPPAPAAFVQPTMSFPEKN